MPKGKARSKQFRAAVKIQLMVEIPVSANTFADALEVAKNIKLDDAVEVVGENLDYHVELQSVSNAEWLDY